MEIVMNGARRCGGCKVHPIKDCARASKSTQVNSSQPLISRVIMAEINFDRWTP